MKKLINLFFLFTLIIIIKACSPSADKPDEKSDFNNISLDSIPMEMEELESDWRMGDPTVLKCEFPDPNIFFILKRRKGRDPILTDKSVSIIESEPQHLQLVWKTENETFIEEIQKITVFDYPEGVAYDLRTTATFGSYDDNTYELTKVNSNIYWELNNIYSDDPNTLLTAIEDVMLFESPRDTAIINLRDKFYELTDDAEIFANLEKNWVNLTNIDEEWVIFDICRYGPDHLYIDYIDGWMEFSGGGDGYPKNIDTLILHDTYLEIVYRDEHYAEMPPELKETTTIQLYYTENNVLILKTGENETRYIEEDAQSRVQTITEECDEEDY